MTMGCGVCHLSKCQKVMSSLFCVNLEQTLYNSSLQGCWANSDGANSDDRANSDDFLRKSLELIFVIIPTFSQILAT